MARNALLYAETIVLMLAVGVPVHFLGGLDWPWALAIGAGAAIVVCATIHGRTATRL